MNEAVERACNQGILRSASLMVAGKAADDAVRRAKTLPHLKVGLHLVLVDGPAILPHAKIPDLVDTERNFSAEQVRRGFSYFFRPPSAYAASSLWKSRPSSPPSPPPA